MYPSASPSKRLAPARRCRTRRSKLVDWRNDAAVLRPSESRVDEPGREPGLPSGHSHPRSLPPQSAPGWPFLPHPGHRRAARPDRAALDAQRHACTQDLRQPCVGHSRRMRPNVCRDTFMRAAASSWCRPSRSASRTPQTHPDQVQPLQPARRHAGRPEHAGTGLPRRSCGS